MNHIFLHDIPMRKGGIHSAYERYLLDWREEAIRHAEDGDVAASVCNQAALVDLILYEEVRHDWLGIMDSFLMDEGKPLAYSEAFGKRLHKYANQYYQSSIHAIYTRWWIEHLFNSAVDNDRYADLILAKKQSDGLIYDRDISETIFRHRMKSEITLSMAMSVDILRAAGRLAEHNSIELATCIVNPLKCPTLGYMSMEYFRLKALQILGFENLFPVGVEQHIEACSEHLSFGWCDFAINKKVDAYMGTAKRTQRDKPIHSPLIAYYVFVLLRQIQDSTLRMKYFQRLIDYARYLNANPMDIPSFQMRDIPLRFGADITPIEVICSSFLINQCLKN